MCSTSLLYKILPTNPLACKAAFYTFQLCITSEENNTLRRCVFIIRTMDRNKMQFFTIKEDKLHLFNIQDARSMRHLCAKWRNMSAISDCSWAPKLARKCEIKHRFPFGAKDGHWVARCAVTWLPNFLGWVDYLSDGAPLKKKRSLSSLKKTSLMINHA